MIKINKDKITDTIMFLFHAGVQRSTGGNCLGRLSGKVGFYISSRYPLVLVKEPPIVGSTRSHLTYFA
jgi:hypothetical protein